MMEREKIETNKTAWDAKAGAENAKSTKKKNEQQKQKIRTPKKIILIL